jgi:hypothetical protein
MTTWKILAIRALFGGIGLAIGAAAIIGAVIWYSDRPNPPPSWNSTALKAKFNTMEFTGASSSSPNAYTVAFEYNVQNTTKATYEVNTSALTPMAILTEGKALSRTFSEYQSGDVVIDSPQFIPPGATGRMTVRVSYFYPQGFTTADKDNFEKSVGPLDQRLKELGSIVLFDGLNHYQIDLPSGWADSPGVKDGTKPDLDPSLLKRDKGATDLPPCPPSDPLGIVNDKRCKPPSPQKNAPPCPTNDPAGLRTESPCAPLSGAATH